MSSSSAARLRQDLRRVQACCTYNRTNEETRILERARMEDARVRLTQITHDLAIGGLQRVVANICRTIDRDRFDVRVLCLRALGPIAADIERLGIPVSLLPQTGRTDYFSFLKVAHILRSEQIDVIHTHN